MYEIFRAVLIVVEVLSSLLLLAVILVQKTRGDGLGLAFGSGMGEALFGSRAGNVLTRITVILTVIFMANTLVLGMMHAGGRRNSATSLMSRVGASAPAQAAPQPQTGAPAPSPAPVGAPTLPGAALDDQAAAPSAPVQQPIQVQVDPANLATEPAAPAPAPAPAAPQPEAPAPAAGQ